MNEQDDTKVYVAGAQTMFEGDIYLAKLESTINPINAVMQCIGELHEKVYHVINNKPQMDIEP